jgi:hypothetical protein
VFDLYPKYFAGEVADVFSYLMGIATEYAMAREIAGQPPFEFEKEFLKRYPGYCFACGNKICICPAVPAATIGRMSKELDLADDDRIFFRDAQAAQARGHDVALRVRRYVGSSEGLLNAIPLDRGEVNQSLIMTCLALAEAVKTDSPEIAERLRTAAVQIGGSATLPGTRDHSYEPNALLDLVREGLAAVARSSGKGLMVPGQLAVDVATMISPATRILVVGSGPADLERIGTDTEARVISEAIRRSAARASIELKTLPATTPDDLRRALLEGDFAILHFTGHGDSDGIYLSNEDGSSAHITTTALKDLISRYPQVQCVLLNSCETMANLTEPLAPITIGMDSLVDDDTAVEFARGFYDAVGALRPIDFAIEEGRNAVTMKKLSPPPLKIIRAKTD